MANPKMQPPTLSLVERDRRWARVRGLMRERGFDGLLVAGFRSREMYETYISDDYNEGCVIFPLEGDPVERGGLGGNQTRSPANLARNSARRT